MAWNTTPNINTQRTKYKALQDHAAVFGVPAVEFNAKVKALLGKGTPTPAEWVFGAEQVAWAMWSPACAKSPTSAKTTGSGTRGPTTKCEKR